MPSSTTPEDKLLSNGLREVQRYITTTSPNGTAILSTEIASPSIWQKVGATATFFLGYTTRVFPARLSSNTDIQSYSHDLSSPPGLSISSGTVVRYVDMVPGSISPMHKTRSLDYGVVIEGEVELVLDSGETRVMRRGDLCVQRATMHAWRNVTPNGGWARMMYVLVAAEGEDLKEDLGDMKDVPESK